MVVKIVDGKYEKVPSKDINVVVPDADDKVLEQDDVYLKDNECVIFLDTQGGLYYDKDGIVIE